MKLPWDKKSEKDEKIKEIEAQLQEKNERIQKLENMLEAEKKRRKKSAREKQDAEEKLNRLKDKLRNTEQRQPEETDTSEQRPDLGDISFSKAVSILEKLDSVESKEKDLVTLYSPSGLEQLSDLRGLKNSISKDQYSQIEDLKGFTAFLDQDTGNTVLEISPFFDSKFVLEEFFDIIDLLEFIRSEKYWVLVSAGETRIFREENGEYDEVESVKSRVDREHSKGGFSQGRFERKREEQIEKHVKQAESVLQDFDEEKLYLLGDERLCKKLPGNFLGGFDPNRKRPEQFYQFRSMRF